MPPIAGGALDQAKHFVSSARFVWQEKSQLTSDMINEK